MDHKTAISAYLEEVDEPGASLLLLLLLGADCVFIALHSIGLLVPFPDSSFYSIEADRGYPEKYQHLKWLWITLLLMYLAVSRRSLAYVAWGALFAYFLLDDALRLHERIGARIAEVLTVTLPFGLRREDLGELVVSACAGSTLLPLLLLAYFRGPQAIKKMSRDMLMLVFALVFFGVVVDMAHGALDLGWKVNFVLGVVEDGGEMVVASLMLWYVFLCAVRGEHAAPHLSAVLHTMRRRERG